MLALVGARALDRRVLLGQPVRLATGRLLTQPQLLAALLHSKIKTNLSLVRFSFALSSLLYCTPGLVTLALCQSQPFDASFFSLESSEREQSEKGDVHRQTMSLVSII